MNARGEGQYFDSTWLAAPVTNDASIRTAFTLMLMDGWTACIVDVKGALLHGNYEDGEKIYMEVPKGFEFFMPRTLFYHFNKHYTDSNRQPWRFRESCSKL